MPPANTAWSPQDDLDLRAALERGDGRLSWSAIAKDAFPGGKYSKADCVERWKILSKPKPIKGPWTVQEDDKLRALVARYGHEKWVMIAGEMQTRSGKQCRERWHNHLDPSINKSDWTVEEELLIRDLFAKIGPRWAEMAKRLPGRPDNSIKNFWNAMQAREKRERSRSTGSISSIVGVEKAQALKAKAAAAAAATATMQAQTAAAVGDPGSPAHAMSRSASSSSLNGARFTPYTRSSPMTKSRSESVSSLSAFSSLRSSTSIETLNSSIASHPSPYTPSGMARSTSVSAFGSHNLPRYPSMHALPRQLEKEMVDPDSGDATEVLSPHHAPFASSSGATNVFRRAHSSSSPPMPTGLHAWAQSSNTPSPPTSGSAAFQPLQHAAAEAQNLWHPSVAAHEQEHAHYVPQPQPMQMVVNASGRLQPLLTPLQIGTDDPTSGFTSYEASPAVSYYDDSRFASPVDMVDQQQHHFMGGAGPLAYDPHAMDAHVSSSSALPPPAPSAYTVGGGAPGAPFVHPQHLATLDEQQVYDSSAHSGVVDEFGQIGGGTSGMESGAPSPHDSGYEHSHHSSFDYSHSHRGSFSYVQGEPVYYVPAAAAQHPVELPHTEDGSRPNMLRRGTAPPTYSQPAGSHSPAAFSPVEAPFAGHSFVYPASLPHHRHAPSLPNLYEHGAVLPHAPPGTEPIPSSATFPSHGGRPRAFSRPTPPSAHRRLGSAIDLSSAPFGPSSSASAQLAGLGIGAHDSPSPSAYSHAYSPSQSGAPSPASAAPSPSHQPHFAGASEPMSKVYSSPMSEIAGRWGEFSLASGQSPSSSLSGPAYLPRSHAQVSLQDLAAEEHALMSSSGGGGADGMFAPSATGSVVSRSSEAASPVGSSYASTAPSPAGSACGSVGSRPALSRSASALSASTGASGGGLAIDEQGRAVLPL
ncbi:hypothetical protein JCM10213_002980 [Rhodosporidiobolus nylandii]